ncbi:MAG: hypothetical protein JWL90_2397 [Chthoniobacteraceae bacterium]|nr:hypothetical protein [Chthoniobacteraceae bacterium]
MIPKSLIHQIQSIRAEFENTFKILDQSSSFQSLLNGAANNFREEWRKLQALRSSPRFRRPCDGRIVCAIVGDSNAGKTSTLDELFPNLARRGWLITDTKDTTSQSLRIEFAAPDSSEATEVVVHSWGGAEIKKLAQAAAENKSPDIEIIYSEDGIVVDGTKWALGRKGLKFSSRQELRAFSDHRVTEAEAADPKFVRALTIKEESDNLESGAVLNTSSGSYNSLQLRAVVKDVTLHDGFERLAALGARKGELADVSGLVFVDTPGLGTGPSTKDEVLSEILAEKSPQIVLQLLEDDELDIVLHLVLCGQQSHFSRLWQALVRERGRSETESLVRERLFVVVNGANRLFEEEALRRRWEAKNAANEGDPFSISLRTNILQMMGSSDEVRPAGICFIDCIKHVSKGDASNYRAYYNEQKPRLTQALAPGGVGYETLQKLGLHEKFAQNIEALCDPDDRGQGFLIRELIEFVSHKGPAIFLKRHLVRTGLQAGLRQLRDLLTFCYDESGAVRDEAMAERLQHCLGFLLTPEHAAADGNGQFAGLERFARTELDPMIDRLPVGKAPDPLPASSAPAFSRLLPRARVDEAWVGPAFRQMCAEMSRTLALRASLTGSISEEFAVHFRRCTNRWAEQWGYDSARLPNPLERAQKTDRLVRHFLKLHAREMLYQLLLGGATAEHGVLEQSEAEKQQLATLMRTLTEAITLAEQLCREHSVSV